MACCVYRHPPWRWWRVYVITLLWIVLVGIQLGLPLRLGGSNSPSSSYTAPIQPQGVAFGVIWACIFLLQGLGSLAPWVDPAGATRPYLASGMFWYWIAGWTAECGWSITQFLMYDLTDDGKEPTWGFYLSLVFLVLSYVCFSLAARSAVQLLQKTLRNVYDPDYPAKRQVLAGVVLYVFPSALNAGWLGLATCLGAVQVAISHGVAYDNLSIPSIVLISVATASIVLQPWALPLRPRSRPVLPTSSDVERGTGSNPFLAGGPASSPPPSAQERVGCMGKTGAWLKALSPTFVALLGYTTAIVWGLGNLYVTDNRPSNVTFAAFICVCVTPGMVAIALAWKSWAAYTPAEEEEEQQQTPAYYPQSSAPSMAKPLTAPINVYKP